MNDDVAPSAKRARQDDTVVYQIVCPVDPFAGASLLCKPRDKPLALPMPVENAHLLRHHVPGWCFDVSSTNADIKPRCVVMRAHTTPTKADIQGKDSLRMLLAAFSRVDRSVASHLVNQIMKTKTDTLSAADLAGRDTHQEDETSREVTLETIEYIQRETRLAECPDHELAFELTDRTRAIALAEAWRAADATSKPGDLAAALIKSPMDVVTRFIDDIFVESRSALRTEPLAARGASSDSMKALDRLVETDPYCTRTFDPDKISPSKGLVASCDGRLVRSIERAAEERVEQADKVTCYDRIVMPHFARGSSKLLKGYKLEPIFPLDEKAPSLLCMTGVNSAGVAFPTKKYILELSKYNDDKIYAVQIANINTIDAGTISTLFNSNKDVASAAGMPAVVRCAEDGDATYTYESEGMYYGLHEAWLDGRTGAVSVTLLVSLIQSEWTPHANTRADNIMVHAIHIAKAFKKRGWRQLSNAGWRNVAITNAHLAPPARIAEFLDTIGTYHDIHMFGDTSEFAKHRRTPVGGLFLDSVQKRGATREAPTAPDTMPHGANLPEIVPGGEPLPGAAELATLPDLRQGRLIVTGDEVAIVARVHRGVATVELADGARRRHAAEEVRKSARAPPQRIAIKHVWMFPNGTLEGHAVSKQDAWDEASACKASALVSPA